jgi:hypothetical protein
LSLLTLWFVRDWRRLMLACAAGFLTPMFLFVLWARTHPEIVNAILGRYSVATGQPAASLLASVKYLAHYLVLQQRLSLWWKYFDPSFLFLAGSPDPALGTRTAGVFLLAAGLLIVVGIYDVINRFDYRRALVCAGFASAPLAPVVIDTGNALQRETVLLPFGALLAVYGARRLLRTSQQPVRWLTAVALIALPLQFAYFAHDYFGAYRVRAADRIDPINMGAIARTVLQGEQQPPLSRVYLSESLDDGVARWHFFTARYHREDLSLLTWVLAPSAKNHWSLADPRSVPFDGKAIPIGSTFFLNAGDPAIGELTGDGKCCNVVTTVLGARGVPSSVIMRKLK